MAEKRMNHKQRLTAALECRTPDSVPTFELEFQLENEMFGQTFDYGRMSCENLAQCGPNERDVILNEYTDHLIDLYYNKLEYSSFMLPWAGSEETTLDTLRLLRKKIGDTAMIHTHGDGTFALPDGNEMYAFSYRIADDWDGLIEEARQKAENAIERNKIYADAGVDLFVLCDDYCYNSGPYISPAMFAELITPFLAHIIEETRKLGVYTIKHTDGNIMPILDQLIDCKPHAIHSLDPMAGVDIAEVKRLTAGKVAICGNVNCALMQTGTDEEVIESCRYAMDSGKPGGGYIYTTSNVPFRGLPAERYQMVLDYWKAHREY